MQRRHRLLAKLVVVVGDFENALHGGAIHAHVLNFQVGVALARDWAQLLYHREWPVKRAARG
jgi:hypothetical protein